MSYSLEDSVYGRGEGAPSELGLFSRGTMIQVGAHSCVIQHFLSAGGHANIYLATLLSDGTTRVLKHIPFSPAHGPEHRAQIEHEIRFMTLLNGHPQIVSLEAAEITDSSAYILMEHCPSDALSLINQTLPGSLDETTILHIFSDACKAVAHMHYQQPPLLHRDLKVENILIAQSGYKLCDFGSATADVVSPGARTPREQIVRLEEEIQRSTTLEYRAPEMIDLYLQRGITEKSDIWALGVLLYKLCYFKTPFDNASPLAILNAEYFIPSTPQYSKQLRHLFQMTLREEPRERSTIYTLCNYVCGLRGEPCLLENKYASPPPSPVEPTAPSQPRRFAASNSKYATPRGSTIDGSGIAEGDSIFELDSSGIVPMRRGRPSKRHDGGIGDLPRSAPVLTPKFRSNVYSSGRTTPEPSPKSGSTTPARRHAPAQPAESGNALGIYHEDPDPSSGFASPADDARAPDEADQMRMSVTSPDGSESLSMDFIQGAVFGSARRASVLRRHPSARSTDGHDDTGSLPTSPTNALPGFVRQPLPPPPPLSPRSEYSAKHALPAATSGVTGDTTEECGATYLASMISPLSLGNATPIDTPRSASAATQNDGAVNLRLSTILESIQTEHGQAPYELGPARREPKPRAPVKSIYEMTLDKLENDARYSMVFDEQVLFDAKARYAAQRSSVYQSPDNYYYASEQQSRARPALPDNATDMASGEGSAIDIDSVIQRAGARNRRKLVAQNNRRSMYIFGGQSAVPGAPEILREDVEDNMRVLSETEIEELLAKMDMYNRELLSEQQKWQLALGSEIVSPSAVNLQSIDRIIEHANDELLRREQAAQDAADTPKAKRAAGILHNVISAAKSTFGKSASSDAVTPPVVCADTSTSSASRSACCIETPVGFTGMPTSRVDSWAGRDDEPLATDVSVVIAEEVKPDVNSYVEPEAVAEAPLVASNAPLPQLQTEPPVAIVSNNDETASSYNASQIDSIETGTMAADIATESGVTANDDIEATPPLSPAKPPHAYDQEAANDVSEAADVDSSSAIPAAAAEECAQMPVSPTLATEPSSPVPSTVVEEEAVSTKVALESSPIGSDVLDIPKTETVESPSVAPTAPAAIPRTSDSSKQAPKLPGMPRSQTAVPVDDPLAEVRARLKKKQSSSALPTANSGSVAAARAAILGTAESKPDAPALPGRVAPKTPVKSVRNLVAMFEQS
ncbi:Ark- serine/threonine protein kinase [Coemansia spiralis]|uniref:non-specific serine/threonine protein kinase n=1 Tax=Coemansia spiralis TaxID=417178 RepID=A0A9W8L3N0_9FUNG|nr:Ark- serine/threonine protein kinase [Coemansia spiralis]